MKEDQKTNSIVKNISIAVLDFIPGRFLFFGVWAILITSCGQRKELVDQPLYDGPTSSMDSIQTILSDSGQFIMRITAPKQNDFENGDREWSNGVFVEYLDGDGEVTTIFSANYVYYTDEEKLYHAVGNVIVKNFENNDELNTEELFWNEEKEEYYTEKFVTINTEGEVHTGEGLKANQDFSEYRIMKPSGTFTLEDDPSNPAPRDIPLEQPKPVKIDETN